VAKLLYRLGRFSFHRRGRVLAVWLLLLMLLGGAAASFKGATSSEFSIPGTESQRALTALQHEFPQAGGATGTIVIASTDGQKLTAAKVKPVVDQAAAVPKVIAAPDPFRSGAVSADGRIALIQVQFSTAKEDLTNAQRDAYNHAGDHVPGLRVEHGGDAAAAGGVTQSTELLGVVVAAVVLMITFGSLMAAGMTLVNALVGVGAGMAGLFALTSVFQLNDAAPTLALMIGLAVGIDYSLFITSRYRQFLTEGMDGREAAGRAVGTAGSAVVFAGATVVIALAGLSVVGIPFLTAMGLAAAGTVAIAVLVALTLLPAFLGFIGRRALPRMNRAGHAAPAGEGFGFRWGRIVTRLRVPILLAGVLALGALALPATHMRLALPDAGSQSTDSPQRRAYDLISQGFGPGFNGRLIAVVTADTKQATTNAATQAAALIKDTRGVLTVAAPQYNATGTTALLPIFPKTGPSSAATENTVHAIRDKVATISGAGIALTGATAIGIDVSQKLADALPIYLILVVGLSILLLMLVFRSILVPLKAAAGFLLTVGATFGITVAVFQQGHLASLVGIDTPGPLVSFLPILLIGILFGLAMDYEVFLVSRMREDHVHGATPRQATINGLGHNARVVTAAALIMISVFSGFVLAPDPVIKSIGFALAIGVFIDAFIVRLTLVPAVMSLLGKAAWWLPRPLDTALPNLDIEGESLTQAAPPDHDRQHSTV
jgi:RND superfamily putative drug exporter